MNPIKINPYHPILCSYQVIYRPIFQILAVFCCKWYERTIFPYCISSRQKKRYRL